MNGSCRNEVLDAWVFTDLDQVREETERCMAEYNRLRPDESLGDISPIEFLKFLRDLLPVRFFGDVFRLWTEITAAMQDPSYTTDEAYR